jgi:hypothetical protein
MSPINFPTISRFNFSICVMSLNVPYFVQILFVAGQVYLPTNDYSDE